MTDVSSQSEKRIVRHIEVDETDARAVDLLQQAAQLSKQEIKRAMTAGAVWISRGRETRRLRRATRAVRAGDQLHLYYDPKVLAETPPEPRLVADLGGYSVWNKPYGLRSQGSKWGDHCTLVRWSERHLQPQRSAFTVHRLDRAASGLMLIAHSKRIAAALAELFRQRTVEKRYLALVEGHFPLAREPLQCDFPIDGKAASSEFSRLGVTANGGRSLIEIGIKTGRKHQIRRHLAELGYPVVGDRLHGRGRDGDEDLRLQAFKLAFHCPQTNEDVEYLLAETDQLCVPGLRRD